MNVGMDRIMIKTEDFESYEILRNKVLTIPSVLILKGTTSHMVSLLCRNHRIFAFHLRLFYFDHIKVMNIDTTA